MSERPVDAERALPDPHVEPTITIERAGRIIGLGRSAAYEAARAGQIPTIAFGRRRLVVPTAKLIALLGADVSAS